MIKLLHRAMSEFSKTMAKSPKYAYLEYKPVISGSLREKTKTFVPSEGDVTCVAMHTQGLEIMNNQTSQTVIRVNLGIADKEWSRVCIEGNVLCPKHLQIEFCDAMQYAFEHTSPELIKPFFLGPFSLKRKDKISCFYMLYRDEILKDLMVGIDFVFAIPHSNYKTDLKQSLNVEEASFSVIPKTSLRKEITSNNAQFLVSYSDIEAKFIINLPNNIREGFIIAKAARHSKLFQIPDAISSRMLEPICTEEFVTTYMLKTCLMHAMSKEELRELLKISSSYDTAYVLYLLLWYYVKSEGKLQFYFDPKINLISCGHEFDIDYDDKLGCCLKRMLIVGFQ